MSIQSRDNSIKGYEYTTDNAITSERMVMMSSNVYSSSVKSSIIDKSCEVNYICQCDIPFNVQLLS